MVFMVALGGMVGVSPTRARHIRRKRSVPIPIESFSRVLSANTRLSDQVIIERATPVFVCFLDRREPSRWVGGLS